jgi:hypothetical protein
MGAKFVYRDKDDAVPRPADGKAAPVLKVRSYIGLGPKFTMAGRLQGIRSDISSEDPQKAKTFDPLAALKRVTRKSPSFSMGARPHTLYRDPYRADVQANDGKAIVPPTVKSTLGGPRYSMTGRTHKPRDGEMPGPGAYDKTSMHINTTGKQGGPSYSMSARTHGGIAYGNWESLPRVKDRLPAVQTAREYTR